MDPGFEVARHYHAAREPLEPESETIIDEKKLEDGCELYLSRGVSIVEFIGTPVYELELRCDIEGELLFSGAESGMLSEAAYRIIIGRIETASDFHRIQGELEEQIRALTQSIGYESRLDELIKPPE